MQLTKDMLDSIQGTHAVKRLHLATSTGLSGSIDIQGDRELPVTLLLDECARSFDKDRRIAALKSAIIRLIDAQTTIALAAEAARDELERI